VKNSNYANDEIIDYFSKQISSFIQTNDKEAAITNKFGFVERTIEINTASSSYEKDGSKEEEINEEKPKKQKASLDQTTRRLMKQMK